MNSQNKVTEQTENIDTEDSVTVSLIVAAALNNAIGKSNLMLWHLPEDLKFFKNKTWGLPIIMGRKTFESVGKPLPGRTNIVVTSNANWHVDGTITANTINDAIAVAKTTNAKELFITGGGEIYKQTLGIADKIYITRVNTTIDGDAFFPEIDTNIWEMTFEKKVMADEKNKFDMSFQTWCKK